MRTIGNLITDLASIKDKVVEAERLGYDGCFSAEINNDPFLPIVLAAEHSERIELMTSIAVAFARNPMTLANTAHDLNEYSEGRFVLGIGSQIKPHITRRLSMPWSRPAARMREFILAMRAVWASWNEGERLDFNGEFYTHNLMTPMFVPQSRQFGAPKVKLAAVGPLMTEVAAEVADGMIAHGFSTEKYLREVTLPAVERGLKVANKPRNNFDICCPVIVVAGANEQEFENNKSAVKTQLAFYASTPGYKGVLEQHGWEELHDRALPMSRAGEWQAMADLITDEVLSAFAVVCENPNEIAQRLQRRCAGAVDSWQVTFESNDPDLKAQVLADLRK